MMVSLFFHQQPFFSQSINHGLSCFHAIHSFERRALLVNVAACIDNFNERQLMAFTNFKVGWIVSRGDF